MYDRCGIDAWKMATDLVKIVGQAWFYKYASMAFKEPVRIIKKMEPFFFVNLYYAARSRLPLDAPSPHGLYRGIQYGILC